MAVHIELSESLGPAREHFRACNNVIPVSVIAGEAPFFTRLLRRARWHWRRCTHLPGDGDRDTFLQRRRWRRGRNSRLFHLRLALPPESACARRADERRVGKEC